MQQTQILVVGSFRDGDREPIALAAGRTNCAVVFCPTIPRAIARLRANSDRPLCILAQSGTELGHLVDAVRDDAELFSVSIIGLLPRATDEGYRQAFQNGADDVVLSSDSGGLTRRIANLTLNHAASRPSATMGRVVVASREEYSRRRLGRTLRQVGFDVSYAMDLSEIAALAADEPRAMFSVATIAASGADAKFLEATDDVLSIPIVGGIPFLFLPMGNSGAARIDGDQIVDVTSKLLFFADEQAKAQFKNRRSSARKLFATIVSFREAGSLQPIYGVTYNISREGLYFRTLDPPRTQSNVWIEMRAPRNEVPIHLRARTMWQRLPGSGKGVMPPGFGVQLAPNQCPPDDLRAYTEGYDELAT